MGPPRLSRSVTRSLSTCNHAMDDTVRNLIICIDGTSNKFGEKVCLLHTASTAYWSLWKEHERDRNVQLDLEGGWGQPKNLVQQWHWNIRSAFLEVVEILQEGPFSQNWFGDRVVGVSEILLFLTPHLCALRDFDRTVLGAYRWLSDNYEPKDRIFLFGMLAQRVYRALANTYREIFRILSWSLPSPCTLGHDWQGILHCKWIYVSQHAFNDYGTIQVGLIHKGNEMQIPL